MAINYRWLVGVGDYIVGGRAEANIVLPRANQLYLI